MKLKTRWRGGDATLGKGTKFNLESEKRRETAWKLCDADVEVVA